MTKLIHRIAGTVFVLIAIADVVASMAGVGIVHTVLKPFLMPMLAVTGISLLGGNRLTQILLGIALAFHCAGDILLMFDGTKMFILGLLGFLFGHIFYMAIFIMRFGKEGMKMTPMGICLMLLLVVGVAYSMPQIFRLEFPMSLGVFIYSAALLMYVYLGIRGLIKKIPGSGFLLPGGLIFIISDGMIALNVFLGVTFPMRGAAVMATYLVAETLLALAVVAPEVSGTSPRKS